MALECTLVVEQELPVSFTCDDATGIAKGSILQIGDYNTVSQSGGDNDKVIGIAAEEKIASDGNTQIAVYLRGIFKGTAGAAGVTAGDAIVTDCATGDDNEIVIADDASENLMGMALETATDLQTFLFQLNPIARKIA